MVLFRRGWTGAFGASCGAILTAFVLSGSAKAAAQISPSAEPTLTVTTREVLLDVVATGPDGQPVKGLKASDFAVTESGAPQTIRDLEEHGFAPAGQSATLPAVPPLPPNTFSNYQPAGNQNTCTVLLLDAMDSPVSAQSYLRQQLIAYLKHLTPGPPIAIFQLDTQMHLIQGFTSDPAVLLTAAESKRDMPSVAKPIQGGRAFNYRVRTDLLQSALQMVGRYLAAFPGRKNLIWFTGQIPMTIFGSDIGNPFPDTYSLLSDDLQPATDVLAMSRVAVYPVDTRGLQADPSFSASKAQPLKLDPQMGWATRQGLNHQNLDMLADATGGKAFYNTKDLKQVIGEAIANGSSYYTLAYGTTNTKWRGQFRKIHITVDRPGVHLQYRNGYFAWDPEHEQANEVAGATVAPTGAVDLSGDADGGAFSNAMQLGMIPATEIVFAASIKPADTIVKLKKDEPLPKANFLRAEWQHKPFRNYTILVRADAKHIEAIRSMDGMRHIKVHLDAIVYDWEGQPVNSLGETESFALGNDAYQELLVSGLAIKADIAIPAKGNFFLRLGVHDLNGGRMGAFEIPADQIKLGVAGEGLMNP